MTITNSSFNVTNEKPIFFYGFKIGSNYGSFSILYDITYRPIINLKAVKKY